MKLQQTAPAVHVVVAALAGLLLGVALSTVARGADVPSGREQAARRYLAIVQPGAEMRARCLRAETMLEDEESPAALDEAKSCLRAYAGVSRDVAGGLRSGAWPRDAARDVERLAAVTSERADALERAAEVRTVGAYWSQRLPEDDGLGDVVRARLGLPSRAG